MSNEEDVNSDILLNEPSDMEKLKYPYGGNGGTSEVKRFVRGSSRSRVRLAQLGFDPIERLVNMYNVLDKEHRMWIKLREFGTITKLDEDGNVKKVKGQIRYSGVAHANVMAQMAKVATDLMRYSYGRVPEVVPNGGARPTPLTINLSSEIVGVPKERLQLGRPDDIEEYREDDD